MAMQLPALLSGEYARPPGGRLPALQSGEFAPPFDVEETGSGGLVFGGEAGVAIVFPSIYSETAVGGWVFGGAALAALNIDVAKTGAGGLLYAGEAIVGTTNPTTTNVTGVGGMALAGTAPWTVEWVLGTSGGLTFSGAALSGLDGDTVGSGGIVLGGAAAVDTIGAAIDVITEPTAMSVTLPLMTTAFDALAGGIATLDVRLPAASVALTASNGGLDVYLPPARIALTGATGATATIDLRLPSASIALSAQYSVQSAMGLTLGAMRVELSAALGSSATLEVDFPALRAALGSSTGAQATLDVRLPGLTVDFTSAIGVSGVLDALMPSFAIRLRGGAVAQWADAYCMNTRTTAVTHLTNFDFNSFAKIDGRYYAAGANGLMEIFVGKDDAGVPIEAAFKTGLLDFGSQHLKRATHMYTAARLDGELRVSATADEGKTIDYVIAPVNAGAIEQRRVVMARGERGRYWQFEVANASGEAFEIDELNALVGETGRRV